jgi:hypothetical protein
MRSIATVLLFVVASASSVSAQQQQKPQTQPTKTTQQPPQKDSWSMDHGHAADAAAAREAAAAKAKAEAKAPDEPLKPSQSTDFSVNGDNMISSAPPKTPEEQKLEAQARAAWEARCRPTVIADREGLRRIRYAEPDCDLSSFNTAGTH